MINFINDPKELKKENLNLYRIFKEDQELPNNLFTEKFHFFLGFEFDLIFDEKFYKGLNFFFNKIEEHEFTLYTLKPSQDYFFEHFSKYSVGKISTNNSYVEIIEFLQRDPGNSPADAIRFSSELLAFFSGNSDVGLIASKDWEIGIVGFSNEKIKKEFLDSFINETMFSTITNRIETINNLLNPTDKAKRFFTKLIENYTIHR